MCNVLLDYANAKTAIEKKDIEDIGLPSDNLGWLVISTCDNLTMDFIAKYKSKLSLEHIIANENCKFLSDLFSEFKDEIDFDKLVFILAYRVFNANPPKLTKNRLAVFKFLEDYEDKINWARFDKDQPFYSLNEDFLKYFYTNIDWESLLTSSVNEIPPRVLCLAYDEGLIDLERLEGKKVKSQMFIENLLFGYFDEHIDIYMDSYDREDFLSDLKNNPDLLRNMPDPSLFGYASKTLKKVVWIDRVAGIDNHYADDEIDWTENGGELGDDSTSYEIYNHNDKYADFYKDDPLEI